MVWLGGRRGGDRGRCVGLGRRSGVSSGGQGRILRGVRFGGIGRRGRE